MNLIRGHWLMMITMLMMMIALAMVVQGNEYEYDESLSYSYYHASCPQLESIIHKRLDQWLKNDSTLASSLINLQFHDCIGCDAFILLDHNGSERTVDASKSLRGFEVINDIKSEVEKTCPHTFSCADILSAAARDATVKSGGPFWMVPYGRKNDKISLANEAQKFVPMGRERVTYLIELFQSKGLNILDLAVLSRAHTIEKSSCGCLQNRLLYYAKLGKPDPSINPRYLNFLITGSSKECSSLNQLNNTRDNHNFWSWINQNSNNSFKGKKISQIIT